MIFWYISHMKNKNMLGKKKTKYNGKENERIELLHQWSIYKNIDTDTHMMGVSTFKSWFVSEEEILLKLEEPFFCFG